MIQDPQSRRLRPHDQRWRRVRRPCRMGYTFTVEADGDRYMLVKTHHRTLTSCPTTYASKSVWISAPAFCLSLMEL